MAGAGIFRAGHAITGIERYRPCCRRVPRPAHPGRDRPVPGHNWLLTSGGFPLFFSRTLLAVEKKLLADAGFSYAVFVEDDDPAPAVPFPGPFPSVTFPTVPENRMFFFASVVLLEPTRFNL